MNKNEANKTEVTGFLTGYVFITLPASLFTAILWPESVPYSGAFLGLVGPLAGWYVARKIIEDAKRY